MPKVREHTLSPLPPPLVGTSDQTPPDGALYEVRSPFPIPSLSRMAEIHLHGGSIRVFLLLGKNAQIMIHLSE
jgi:hypothetical protein